MQTITAGMGPHTGANPAHLFPSQTRTCPDVLTWVEEEKLAVRKSHFRSGRHRGVTDQTDGPQVIPLDLTVTLQPLNLTAKSKTDHQGANSRIPYTTPAATTTSTTAAPSDRWVDTARSVQSRKRSHEGSRKGEPLCTPSRHLPPSPAVLSSRTLADGPPPLIQHSPGTARLSLADRLSFPVRQPGQDTGRQHVGSPGVDGVSTTAGYADRRLPQTATPPSPPTPSVLTTLLANMLPSKPLPPRPPTDHTTPSPSRDSSLLMQALTSASPPVIRRAPQPRTVNPTNQGHPRNTPSPIVIPDEPRPENIPPTPPLIRIPDDVRRDDVTGYDVRRDNVTGDDIRRDDIRHDDVRRDDVRRDDVMRDDVRQSPPVKDKVLSTSLQVRDLLRMWMSYERSNFPLRKYQKKGTKSKQ